MASPVPIPEGHDSTGSGGFLLIAPAGMLADLQEAGLHHPDGWETCLAAGGVSRGRGSVGTMTTPAGRRLVLKKLRRGGLAAALHRDRFRGSRRLLANLTLPVELARRGVTTAEPAGLLLREGPSGRYQGWLATRELEDAVDAAAWLEATGSNDLPPGLLRFVRSLHDAGLVHRDLNLGNLLIRAGDEPEVAAVIDLDGAGLLPGPLPLRSRLLSLWRLERSLVKLLGRQVEDPQVYRPAWAAAYAAGDRSLEHRILRWWKAGAALLAVHRAGY